jgi:integrase
MAKETEKLSARALRQKATLPGLHADGGNLYLQVSESGAASWIFRYKRAGKATDVGLGSFKTRSIKRAREKATELRDMLLDGRDPLAEKHEARALLSAARAKAMTFNQCAEAYIEAHRAGWRNAKHADQWQNTLTTYCGPVFGALPIEKVDLPLVMKVLEPIWQTKTETASRLRGRIEAVLGWATVRGYRSGDNPARWKGHLDKLLPQRSKVQKVEHHAALPYAEIGAFMRDLRAQNGVAAKALEFQILTCSRPGEVRGALWSEIDKAAKLWIVPASRMKANKDHRVPLSARAIEILEEVAERTDGELVFPGRKEGKPLSDATLIAVMERMGRTGLTSHGFRSTFRDWAAEQTNFPHEMAEMALAHTIGNKAEAAYRRGDLFEKRLRMAEAWARYCSTVDTARNIVVPIHRGRGAA